MRNMVLYTCQMVMTIDTIRTNMAYYGNEIEVTIEKYRLPLPEFVRTGYVMPEGAVFLPNSDGPDEWFESIDYVQSIGYSTAPFTKLTGKSVLFDPDDIKESLQTHEGPIPECMVHWLKK